MIQTSILNSSQVKTFLIIEYLLQNFIKNIVNDLNTDLCYIACLLGSFYSIIANLLVSHIENLQDDNIMKRFLTLERLLKR